MGDLITRTTRFLFDGARPIDRTILIVDVLVLVVIAVELVRDIWHERTSRQRRQLVQARLASLREAISEGQSIQHSAVPSGDTGTDNWYKSVTGWTRKTTTLVEGHSIIAKAAFVDVSEAPPAQQYQHFAAAQEYVHLLARLKNLRRIMENPDVYL